MSSSDQEADTFVTSSGGVISVTDMNGLNENVQNQLEQMDQQMNQQMDQQIRRVESNLSDIDKENINQLTALGFSAEIVTQTYIICGKNKEVTASILFELI